MWFLSKNFRGPLLFSKARLSIVTFSTEEKEILFKAKHSLLCTTQSVTTSGSLHWSVLNAGTPVYQEALKRSGYDHKLLSSGSQFLTESKVSVSEDQQQVSALKSRLSSLPCLFNSSDEGEDNSWDALDQVPYTFVKTVKSKKEKGEFSSLMTWKETRGGTTVLRRLQEAVLQMQL